MVNSCAKSVDFARPKLDLRVHVRCQDTIFSSFQKEIEPWYANIPSGSNLSCAIANSTIRGSKFSHHELCLYKKFTIEGYPIGSIPPRTEHGENPPCVCMPQPPFNALSYL